MPVADDTPPKFFPWGVGNPTFYLVATAGVGVAGAAFVGSATSFAVAFATGLAAFMGGGVFGFLFGIPRYATSSSERTALEQAGSDAVKYRANTNLEQISDWLTKILVGLGLTQFRAIGSAFTALTVDIGEALTGNRGETVGRVEAGSLLVLTFASGFVFFYLWSRVYLPKLFREAETSG